MKSSQLGHDKKSFAKKIVTIDDAIEEIKRRHDRLVAEALSDTSKSLPLIVGVFGPSANVGKTYFCKTACERLHTPYSLDAYVSTSPELNLHSVKKVTDLKYLFYEVGLNHDDYSQHEIDVWNLNIRPHTGKNMDLNVLIFNPYMGFPNIGSQVELFDIIISNPHSFKKPSRF